MKILGLDPGIDRLGWAIITEKSEGIELTEYGLITTNRAEDSALRLAEISQDLRVLCAKFKPDLVCIERLFFSVNAKTAMLIAEVRGVIKATCALESLRTTEVHPLQLKKRLVGTGKAKKKEVQQAITGLFSIDGKFKTDDVADAIGIGYIGLLEEKGHI